MSNESCEPILRVIQRGRGEGQEIERKFLNALDTKTDTFQRRISPKGSARDGFMRGNPVRRDLNVLALIKGNERYVYVYDDVSRADLVNAFRDDAANPRLSLSWLDVAELTAKAREQGRTAADEPPAESRV